MEENLYRVINAELRAIDRRLAKLNRKREKLLHIRLMYQAGEYDWDEARQFLRELLR